MLARLPFVPFNFIQNVSHRNLPGNDATDTGMVFIFMLCAMSIKPNLQRALGHAPPKTAVPAAAQRAVERWTGVTS